MKRFFFVLLALMLLSGCQTPEATPFAFTDDNFPRLDGSTATIPLGQALTTVLLGKTATQAEERIRFSGTNDAYAALAEGYADLLLVYEPPKEAEENHLDAVELAPIGRDALVFLLNIGNPADSLTHEEIVGIYTGEITDWGDVGGDPGEIRAFQRNLNSGSQTLMRKLVMGDFPLAEAPIEYIVAEMGGLVEAIAAFDTGKASIGYNVYYFVSRMAVNAQVKLLAVNGVAPSNDTIRDGSYPYVNDFYAVIRKDEPADSPARILCEWLRSADGQTLVENAGYVGAGTAKGE